MRIAYISYEYPPDISAGGIATYTLQAARVMKSRGHDVEVFCGSFERNLSEFYENVLTHRVKISNVHEFRKNIVPIFKERHHFKEFEIFESPEINGNGYNIKLAFPEVPMTVKLHTPAVLQIRILNTYTTFFNKLRFFTGALRRGKFDLGYWSRHDKNQNNDIDYQICVISEKISSPSISLKNWAVNFWKIKSDKIEILPYPYIAEEKLLNISYHSSYKTITFFGKLNVHKGMVAFTDVIPNILDKHPDYKFIIIGKDGNSHKKGISMKEYMYNKLRDYSANIEFIDSIPLDKIPEILEKTDICVFPSIWDNFPLVCLESMSAGRAIVGSREGGMFDMLKPTNAGILINPKKVIEIAGSINYLIENPDKRIDYGKRARQRVLDEYNAEKIGTRMENFYRRVILNKE